jgi:hypothetical protein
MVTPVTGVGAVQLTTAELAEGKDAVTAVGGFGVAAPAGVATKMRGTISAKPNDDRSKERRSPAFMYGSHFPSNRERGFRGAFHGSKHPRHWHRKMK